MGVYIKGMEMPKACAFCRIKRRNGKKMVCPLLDEEWDIHDPMSTDYRLNNCPLRYSLLPDVWKGVVSMGAYIKGMEMPVTCCHCPLMGYDPDIEWVDGVRETQGAYICVITHELIDNTKREEHCPLVPVSEHGRLIDADAMVKDNGIKEIPEYYEVVCDAPTIIPAEPGEEETT